MNRFTHFRLTPSFSLKKFYVKWIFCNNWFHKKWLKVLQLWDFHRLSSFLHWFPTSLIKYYVKPIYCNNWFDEKWLKILRLQDFYKLSSFIHSQCGNFGISLLHTGPFWIQKWQKLRPQKWLIDQKITLKKSVFRGKVLVAAPCGPQNWL